MTTGWLRSVATALVAVLAPACGGEVLAVTAGGQQEPAEASDVDAEPLLETTPDSDAAGAAGSASSHDASNEDATADSAPNPDVSDAGGPEVITDALGDDALDTDQGNDVLAEPEAEAAPDGPLTCWCKNWVGETYPDDFFGYPSCVDDYACGGGTVCCAITCVSPDVCVNTAMGWASCQNYGAPNDCCNVAVAFVKCVLPAQCAPEGILVPKKYDPAVNNFGVCLHPDGH
jgi:hypothetical protein